MSTMFPDTNRALANFGRSFTVWLHRSVSRDELRNFSDRELRDIGLARCDAQREYTKPFWMA